MFFKKKFASLEARFDQYDKLVQSTINLIQENQHQQHQIAAFDREKNGFTFGYEMFGMEPEYGPVTKKDIKIGDPTLGKGRKDK